MDEGLRCLLVYLILIVEADVPYALVGSIRIKKTLLITHCGQAASTARHSDSEHGNS